MTTPSRRARRLAAALVALAAVAIVPATARSAAPQASATTPSYTEYDLGFTGGEPGISYDGPQNDTVWYAAGLTVKALHWDDKGVLTATDNAPPLSPDTLDTINVSDPRTGRTFVSYLALACSIMAYTDGEEGGSWTQSTGCGAGAAVDHQTVGVGPLHAPVPATTYDGAVYYCAQDSFNGQCSVSIDGGVTFAPAVPVANTPANLIGDPLGGACSALHGHVRVGPDGTAYLPLKGCGGVPTPNNLTNSEFFGGRPSLTVSENNGLSWEVRLGPEGSHNPDESDPSVAIGPEGTVYMGWEDGTNPTDAVGGDETAAMIATSTDGGRTWSDPVDVGKAFGLHNVQFPEVIVGDDDRAAYAFIGTPGIGNDQDNAFRGDWRLYVATTYDAGKTWTTVDATPKNLINKGCVHMLGLAPGSQRTDVCDFRNMLDFNDITIDKDGRVLVAYTDACLEECSAKDGVNADGRELFALRQSCGKGLYAASDATLLSAATCKGTAGVPGPVAPPTAPRPRPAPPVAAPPHAPLPATGLPGGVALVALVLTVTGVAAARRRRVGG